MNKSFFDRSKEQLVYIFFLSCIPWGIFGQQINQMDANGKRHGVWKKYYEGSKKLRYEGTFDHGKEMGEFKFYKPSSKNQPTAIKIYEPDNDTVKVSYFTAKGILISKGAMCNKKREGKWHYFHRNSEKVMTEETYDNGLLQGEKLVYFPDGTLTEKTIYDKGKREGKSFVYSEEGVVIKAFTYENDELHGRVAYFTSKGVLMIEGDYKRDRKDGLWKYYEGGKLKEQKKYPLERPDR